MLGDAILDVAWRLFVDAGYKQLTVDAITREAAVSKRTVYDRFGSREGLFEALWTIRMIMGEVSSTRQGEPDGDGREAAS